MRRVRAHWSHALTRALARVAVGRAATRDVESPESVVAESADRFVDVGWGLAVEMIEGAAHLAAFGALLRREHPALARWVVALSVLGTGASAWLGSNLPALFRRERLAEAELVFHLTRARENAESIQFYGGRDAEVAKADALDARRQVAVLDRKTTKDALEVFNAVVRRLASGVVPYLVLASAFASGSGSGSGSAAASAVSAAALSANPTHGALSPMTSRRGAHHGHSHGDGDGDRDDGDDDEPAGDATAALAQATEAFDEILYHLLVFAENAHDFSRLDTTSREICALLDAYANEDRGGVALETRRFDVDADTGAGAPWLEARDLSVWPPRASMGAARPLVRRLNLALAFGDTLLVTGPSGCGKTALLRVPVSYTHLTLPTKRIV